MTIKEFVELFKTKNIQNTKVDPNAVEDFIRQKINITEYTPFKTKCSIATIIINKNVKDVDGYKFVDSASQFLGFIMSMIATHTDLTTEEPYADYDALCASGLLQPIIATFQQDYNECETILKMKLADELQSNTTPAIVAQFLNEISEKLGGFSGVLSEKLNDLDIGKVLGSADLNTENLDLIKGILDK